MNKFISFKTFWILNSPNNQVKQAMQIYVNEMEAKSPSNARHFTVQQKGIPQAVPVKHFLVLT